MVIKRFYYETEPGSPLTTDVITDYLDQFPYRAFLDSDVATYSSLHGGGPLIVNSVLTWLNENVGKREDMHWTWLGNKNQRTEFAFHDEGDAAHFILVWGGDNGSSY